MMFYIGKVVEMNVNDTAAETVEEIPIAENMMIDENPGVNDGENLIVVRTSHAVIVVKDFFPLNAGDMHVAGGIDAMDEASTTEEPLTVEETSTAVTLHLQSREIQTTSAINPLPETPSNTFLNAYYEYIENYAMEV